MTAAVVHAQSPSAVKRRTVLERFPAGAPRGSWPAEEFAAGLRRNGRQVDVVMDLLSDAFLVVEAAAADDHSKTKDPLPSRPRGPHPYRTAVAS